MRRARREAGFGEGEFDGVHAEAVFGGILEEGFGVDGTGEMHVEIRAFGHALKPGMELERAGLAGGGKGGLGAALGGGCGGTLGGRADGEQGAGGERKQNDGARHTVHRMRGSGFEQRLS